MRRKRVIKISLPNSLRTCQQICAQSLSLSLVKICIFVVKYYIGFAQWRIRNISPAFVYHLFFRPMFIIWFSEICFFFGLDLCVSITCRPFVHFYIVATWTKYALLFCVKWLLKMFSTFTTSSATVLTRYFWISNTTTSNT